MNVFHIEDHLAWPHVVGEKVFHIEGRAPQLLSWEEYGFRIRVQENITSGGCDVTVKAIVAAGQIDLPEGCELVSAVYDISLSRKLTELITIEIEHCAKLENEAQCEYLSFVSTQDDDQFKLIEGGIFYPNTQYGALSCNCFSRKGIVKRSRQVSLPTRKRNKLPQFSEDQPLSKKICPNARQQRFDCLKIEPDLESVSQPSRLSPDPTTVNSAVINGTDTVSAATASSEQHQFGKYMTKMLWHMFIGLLLNTCIGGERYCPPATQYMARAFGYCMKREFLWSFLVYNDLQALDKVYM